MKVGDAPRAFQHRASLRRAPRLFTHFHIAAFRCSLFCAMALVCAYRVSSVFCARLPAPLRRVLLDNIIVARRTGVTAH